MAKDRKKKRKQSSRPQQTVVHRYSAEDEEKKDNRKKLKIKSIIGLIVAALAIGAGLLINFLVF